MLIYKYEFTNLNNRPWRLKGKELACNMGDLCLIPGS